MDTPYSDTELGKLKNRPVHFSDGSHMVGIYTVEENMINAVAPFFAEGIRNGERCFYGASPQIISNVRKALSAEGINVDGAAEKGQLVLLDKKEPLLKDGKFDAAYLVELYRNDVDQAIKDGWKHVRATAEMSWLIEGEDGRDNILYYEALSTRLFNNTDKVHAICQYNTARMSGAEIIELLKIHPWALIDNRIGKNPFWIDPSPDMYAPG